MKLPSTLTQLEITSNDIVSSDTSYDITSPIGQKEETLTDTDDHSGQHPTTPLPIIAPLPY
jgi:hypothetical protein